MLEARVSFLIQKRDKKWLAETLDFSTINFLSYIRGVVVVVVVVVVAVTVVVVRVVVVVVVVLE